MPEEKKAQLLKLIIEEQFSIKDAATKLGINYSTAKYTIKQFKKQGKIRKVSSFKFAQVVWYIMVG